MGKVKDVFDGKKKLTGKAIRLTEDKKYRLMKVESFVGTYGRGDVGLTELQKRARIEKYIGDTVEVDKVLGLGSDKDSGVKLNNKLNFHKTNNNEENAGEYDPISKDIIDNLGVYPKDLRAGKNRDGTDQDMRIVYVVVKDNGSMEISHIHKDGKENDPKTRVMSGVIISGDYTSALNNVKRYKEGKLSEVSDRVMAILDSEEVLDTLFEDDSIDTDEDKYLQM